MGQVLGFAHCKEAPSTASTTPDSTEGGSEDSAFPELPAPEPPEEEEEDEDEDEERAAAWGDPRGPPRDPPRELTFSYIAFGAGGGAPQPEPGPRGRRDPRRGRAPRLSSGGSPRGPDPRAAARASPKRPGEPPAHPEGALPDLGGAEAEETPGSPAAPAPLPAPPPGGAPRPPPPEPPPASAPPPPPSDQSESAAGADGQVWELLYWRAPERSALALLVALVALGCLSRFSAVSVGAHAALAVLAVTVPLRLRQLALRALSPPPAPEPPAPVPPSGPLSAEQQQRWARFLARHVVTATRTLTRLFLVRSVPESLKFAFLFYLLTYVGAVCNGLTLLGAGVICAFTFPVLYRRHQAQIDQYTSLARSHLSHLRARLLAKLPSAKAKPQ